MGNRIIAGFCAIAVVFLSNAASSAQFGENGAIWSNFDSPQ